MVDNKTQRQMFKQIGSGSCLFTYSGGTISTATPTGEGWEYIEQATPHIPNLINRQYIDLAGYTQKDLTLFTQSVDFQHDKFSTAHAESGLQPQVMYIYDILTTRRINRDELSDLSNSTPGFLNSTLDLMECVYGQQTTAFLNTNIELLGGMVPTYSDTFGSGNATASDRLHWTRIIWSIPLAQPQEQYMAIETNETNLVVAGITGKEKDLVYIERLRRAYTQER
jgi:hypothetical protein